MSEKMSEKMIKRTENKRSILEKIEEKQKELKQVKITYDDSVKKIKNEIIGLYAEGKASGVKRPGILSTVKNLFGFSGGKKHRKKKSTRKKH